MHKGAVCGDQQMLLFHRKPEVGEHYFSIGVYRDGASNWMNEDGTPVWDLCIKYASSYGWYNNRPGLPVYGGGDGGGNHIVVKYV